MERGRSCKLATLMKSIEDRRKRQREEEEEEEENDEEDVEHYRMMVEEEEWLEESQVFQHRRNTCMRPGGTNATGRVNYKDSVWGRMLRDPQLSVGGSPLQKIFMRRF